jgi:geranylgeranyl diphosphate synthase type I
MTSTAYPPPEVAAMFAQNMGIVDAGVRFVSQEMQSNIAGQPPDVAAAIDSCTSLLENGGKRWRGVLAVVGYKSYGGDNDEVISRVAGALEALHTSFLVHDDVHDNSNIRRGQPAAHISMANYFAAKNIPGDLIKRGRDMAQGAAMTLQNQAQAILLGVNAPPKRIIAANRILNISLTLTGVGQLRDISPVNFIDLDPDEILETYRLKTGIYTIAMPTQMGAALAGAPLEELSYLDDYADPTGKAFQLRDDLIGIFGDEAQTGKPAKTDIIEAKPTWLIAKTLEAATDSQTKYLLKALGDTALDDTTFAGCKTIISETGAMGAAENLIARCTESALDALDATPSRWGTSQIQFLRGLVQYNAVRQT